MDLSALQAIKLVAMQLTGLSRDALHVYGGLIVLFASAALLRKPLSSPWPWLIAMVVACGVEVHDALDGLRQYGHWRARASLHDIINTMFWPSMLLLATRYTNLFRSKQK